MSIDCSKDLSEAVHEVCRLSHLTVGSGRDQVIALTLTARIPDEIKRAKHTLEQWLQEPPDDTGRENAFEVLALRGGNYA